MVQILSEKHSDQSCSLGLLFRRNGINELQSRLDSYPCTESLLCYPAAFSADNKLGLFILGNIFLATTGAEALYSDLGHVGKRNIRLSWPYVKICLVINYFGQAAWLLNVYQNPEAQQIKNLNPFFQMMPQSWIVIGVAFATVAAVIASQALITGSFTLVSEAIKLKLLPRLKIMYPGNSIGQMYIPAVNLIYGSPVL